MNGFGSIRRFRIFRELKGVLILVVILLAACQPAAVPTTAPEATTAPAETSAPTLTAAQATTEAPTAAATESLATPAGAGLSEATLNVADSEFGPILVDGQGMTLYIFTKDEPDKSNCEGECLEKWPPLLTQGNPTLGEGVDPSMVGSTTLADGTQIVTYNGMPLYYWWEDSQPGDTDGQGVGEVWYVVSPEGEIITGADASKTPTSEAQPAASEASIAVADDPVLGPILVDGQGMTLYIFTKDEPDKSNCTGECLEKWPPLLTQGNPTLGEGVDPALVGSTVVADGSQIVTYNHMPLYYWIDDKQPGDTTGQGVGEVWYVISPAGEVIGRQPAIQPTVKPDDSMDESGGDY